MTKEEYYKIFEKFVSENGEDHWLSKDIKKVVVKNKTPSQWIIKELTKKKYLLDEKKKVGIEEIQKSENIEQEDKETLESESPSGMPLSKDLCYNPPLIIGFKKKPQCFRCYFRNSCHYKDKFSPNNN